MHLPLSRSLTFLLLITGSFSSLFPLTDARTAYRWYSAQISNCTTTDSLTQQTSRSQSSVIFATVEATPAPDRRVFITWRTVSEFQVQSYEVLHTTDGQGWITIGSVPPGDSTANSYLFTHLNPPVGDNYYRIQRTTLKTDPQLSEIVYAHCEEPSGPVLFPNPASSHVYITRGSGTEGAVRVFNSHGRDVTNAVSAGSHAGNGINVSHLSEGLYYLHTDNDVFKFVVAR